MTSLNTFSMIWVKPMNGTNHSQWKANLYIDVDHEKHKFGLTTLKPNKYATDAFEETNTQ